MLKSDGQIYDFCLDWQMNFISKRDLCKQFRTEDWDFTQFENVAKKYKWFTNSMYALFFADDFSS
jgi:hypothetical protein